MEKALFSFTQFTKAQKSWCLNQNHMGKHLSYVLFDMLFFYYTAKCISFQHIMGWEAGMDQRQNIS